MTSLSDLTVRLQNQFLDSASLAVPPASYTEAFRSALGQRHGVVLSARVAVQPHEPGEQAHEDVREGFGLGPVRLPFVEDGVDREPAVFVLDASRKGGAAQFGGEAFEVAAEQAPVLTGMIGRALFAVFGERRRGEAMTADDVYAMISPDRSTTLASVRSTLSLSACRR